MFVPEPPHSCKVYTPMPLALAMVRSIAEGNSQRWLEPSCGTGVFLKALIDIGVPRRKIVGVDLDEKGSDSDQLGIVTRGADFLAWSRTRHGRFDCIVGNPPYVSIQRLPEVLKQTASQIRDFDDKVIGDRSNTWYPFLVCAIKSLRAGGNLAFVLPAACEYADYAAYGRAKLTKMFDRVDVVRSRRPLFDNVSEGVVVLVAYGKGGSSGLYRRHEVDNLEQVVQRLSSLSKLTARTCPNGPPCNNNCERVVCSDIIDVRIGGVTGDAGYFLLSETKRKRCRIPKSALIPVVTRSRHVLFGVHTEEVWRNLMEAGEKIWLFSPKKHLVAHPAVQRYINLDENNGGCHKQRYKIRIREPWFNTPMPKKPDAFLSGMSTSGLWMCMNENNRLTATNTLYVATFRNQLSRAQRYAWALSMLTTSVQKQVVRRRRVYADGLIKLEPGQILELELPVPPKIKNAVSVYRKVIGLFLKGEKREAGKIADMLIHG